jgi:uncharacterized protein
MTGFLAARVGPPKASRLPDSPQRPSRWSTVTPVTTMLTWQAHDGHGFEGARVHFGKGKAFRALGRIVRAEPGGDWTASYRLVVAEDGSVERASFTSATAARERHLTVNRTEDGYWLLDTGQGGTRDDFSGAIDVDLAGSVIFNALPVRRLDLHHEAGEHTLPVLYVTLPGLDPSVVQQTYHVLSTGEQPVVEFRSKEFTADLSLDGDGFVIDYPGLAGRYAGAAAAS